MQETQEPQVRPLGWEDPLEEGMATHSSILAWRILWTEKPGGLWSTGSQRAAGLKRLSNAHCELWAQVYLLRPLPHYEEEESRTLIRRNKVSGVK